MESTPSSGSETTAPLIPDTAPTSPDLSWVRSRRVQTFALGALVGHSDLSLVVVVSTIFAAASRIDGRRSGVNVMKVEVAPDSGWAPAELAAVFAEAFVAP